MAITTRQFHDKEKKMLECPACAGPAEVRAYCATCNGTMEVTQQVFDNFIISQKRQEEVFEFWNKVQEFMYQDGNFKFEANGELYEIVSVSE